MLSLKENRRNERTYDTQDWRIRTGWSGVHCHASLLRSVWLTQTECTGPGHRLSLLLARPATAPESDLSPQELDFPLEQIARLLEEDLSLEQLRGMFTLKQAQTQQLINTEQARLT